MDMQFFSLLHYSPNKNWNNQVYWYIHDKEFFFFGRAVESLTKSIQKNQWERCRRLWKTLIDWYSCHKSSGAGSCHTFLVSLNHTLFMATMIQVFLFYVVQDVFKGFLSTDMNRGTTQNEPFFSRTGLRNTFLAKELFLRRPSLIHYLLKKVGKAILFGSRKNVIGKCSRCR